MPQISRRHFSAALLALGAQPRRGWGATSNAIDQTLRSSVQQHKIPACVAMAATTTQTTYSGAFGKRDSKSGVDVNPDSLFVIASMTKPVTSVAAMQLVEQGKLKLDEPASTYIQELGSLQVLHGFEPGSGKPILKPATKPVTLPPGCAKSAISPAATGSTAGTKTIGIEAVACFIMTAAPP